MGVVSPLGTGREPFRNALFEGRSGIAKFQQYDAPNLPVNFGGEVRDFEPKEHIKPRKSLKMMCRSIQMGIAAAGMAIRDSGLDPAAVDHDRFGVVCGAEVYHGELEELAEVFRSCTSDGKFYFDRWGEAAMHDIFPLWMLKYLPNMPACQISIAHDARGPNNSIDVGDVSSLLAVKEASEIIERGQADMMIAGGASCRVQLFTLLVRGEGRLDNFEGDPSKASRPFDLDRAGFVAGEGAGAVLLESRRHAEARRAPILAEVLGFGSCFEPAPRGEPRQGTAIAASIETALRAAGMEPEQVGHVNAHGLSTVHADAIEAGAIRRTLGDTPVTAPKSYFGNLGAGSGAVELAASLLALAEERIPPTLNYETPDPKCPVHVVHGGPLKSEKPTAMVLNQSTAGQAVAMLLGRRE
jgi:3-oxoacyl-[acyl-carrier-protein] synthase II